jgi:hypothetical protein
VRKILYVIPGPRTAHGKKRIRRNALRHGLAAVIVDAPGVPAEIDRLALAICGADAGPAQREQALVIAECELILLRARAARVKILEGISLNGLPQKSDEPRSASLFSYRQDATSCLEQLMRLVRYEQRAFSRRNRAIRAFSVLSKDVGAASAKGARQ